MITNIIYGINWGDSWSRLQKTCSQHREISRRHTFSLLDLWLDDSQRKWFLILELHVFAGYILYTFHGLSALPIQVGVVAFHCARAPGTAWHRIALDPFSRYPGLHSNRTTEPAENSEPIRLPYRGSGTELHWLSLVRGTATMMVVIKWHQKKNKNIVIRRETSVELALNCNI